MWVIRRITQIARAVDHRDVRNFCRKVQQMRKSVLQRKSTCLHTHTHTHTEESRRGVRNVVRDQLS